MQMWLVFNIKCSTLLAVPNLKYPARWTWF